MKNSVSFKWDGDFGGSLLVDYAADLKIDLSRKIGTRVYAARVTIPSDVASLFEDAVISSMIADLRRKLDDETGGR